MKKYLMMLFALLMMGSASVVMTSCGDDDDEKGSSKGPKTVDEAMSMLYGQWQLPQAFIEFATYSGQLPWELEIDEYYMALKENGNWRAFYHVSKAVDENYAKFVGKYLGEEIMTKQSEDYCFASPDEQDPSTGLFPFALGGFFQLPYRNLTNESVEVNFYLPDEDGNDGFEGLGWQKMTKVKKPITLDIDVYASEEEED